MYMRKNHKRMVHSRGVSLDGKIHLPLMTRGEIFIRCRGQRHGSRGRKCMVPGGVDAWFQGDQIYQM
jgi:hypothetical protein